MNYRMHEWVHAWISACMNECMHELAHAWISACTLGVGPSVIFTQSRDQPTKWYCSHSRWFSLPQLTQLRKPLTGTPTCQSNLDNCSLRPLSKVIHCVKWTVTTLLLPELILILLIENHEINHLGKDELTKIQKMGSNLSKKLIR